MAAEFRCGGLLFTSKFDSGNLAGVEKVERSDSDSDGAPNDPYGIRVIPDYEFNVWTKPDCGGTPYENGNRSWFYFGIRGNTPNKVIKINIVNLNRQGKLYSQGMSPMVKVLPSKPKWERIRDRATYQMVDGQFTLSFTYRFSDHKGGTTYFAFCFPWSYAESQDQLEKLDETFPGCAEIRPGQLPDSAVYYHREVACFSLDKRKIDVLTITSCKGMLSEREPRLENLFPDKSVPRPHKFSNKRVYYVSSRVHPGETPASFVFNGFLEFALRENDARAQVLRDRYVIKMIPMLNPDGVYRGHYRTDQRGVNLNRLYLMPDFRDHPSIYATRSLLLFYHHYYQYKDQNNNKTMTNQNGNGDTAENSNDSDVSEKQISSDSSETEIGKQKSKDSIMSMCFGKRKDSIKEAKFVPFQGDYLGIPPRESGIAFYVDLHGHASKRGCFIYGNHLEIEEDQVDNLLFPKLISLNSAHFDFNGCNFTERNMYLKDKRDGMSKEGSGRVAIFKTTGIIHSYTLECNYNTGRTVNCIASTVPNGKATPPPPAGFPPKYTPEIFEGVGRAMAIAALDFYGCNPWSRLKHSEFTSLENLRNWMTRYVRSSRGNPILPRKMTTRIPITNSNLSTNINSNGTTNGTARPANNRFSGSSDSRKNAVSTYRNGPNSNGSSNGSNGTKRVVATTKNQLSPFKSMSTPSVSNIPGTNRFTNRQKTLIRVTVNNNGRTVKTTQEQPTHIKSSKSLQPCQKSKMTQETPVTLSFTTMNAGLKNSIIPSPAALPNVIESLGPEIDERLLICLRALESPSFPHSVDGSTMLPYTPPNLNSSLQNGHLASMTPPLHHRSLPQHIRNDSIIQSLTQEYNMNNLELPAGDTRGLNHYAKQANYLLGRAQNFGHVGAQKQNLSQNKQQYPRLRESGFISPQVCKPPSFIGRGKSALSMEAPMSHVASNKITPTSSDRITLSTGNIPSSSSFHNNGQVAQPVVLTIDGAEKHLPLTVTRKPIIHPKDENANFMLKMNGDVYNPTTRPPIVHFKPNGGLLPEKIGDERLQKTPTPSKRVSKLRQPRKIGSGKREVTRRGSGSQLSAKSGIDKEMRYLRTPKSGRNSRNGNITGPMLSGEAVQLTPRVQKTVIDDSIDSSRVIPTMFTDAESLSQMNINTTSPTAINASIMMMNCSPKGDEV
uniref:cytosolic carboxypeptidase-like protein 5 n=1 Tax=Styela clava TaxID=7725 RepID=UPI00193A5B73|nr:cytosolic carboxypeptidase-like protein 5 [Styela clava]